MIDINKVEGLGWVVATGKKHKINHLELEPSWEPEIYQIESKEIDKSTNKDIMTGDKAVGGANGLANVQAKQLGNRTEWLYNAVSYILNYLKEYTPDGASKIQSVFSPEKPADSKILWFKVNEEEADANSELIITTEDGEQFDLFDGKTIITVGGIRYALVGANAGIDTDTVAFPTIPSSNNDDTVPSGNDTVPADIDETISADDDNYAGQSDYDTLLPDLFGSDDNG